MRRRLGDGTRPEAASECAAALAAVLKESGMKAMVYRGPYRVTTENKPDPVIEHPNDAIVRVTRAAICGSDLHLYHGLVPDTRVGMTFGHEFTGIVEEVGPNVKNLRAG